MQNIAVVNLKPERKKRGNYDDQEEDQMVSRHYPQSHLLLGLGTRTKDTKNKESPKRVTCIHVLSFKSACALNVYIEHQERKKKNTSTFRFIARSCQSISKRPGGIKDNHEILKKTVEKLLKKIE